MKTIVFTVFFKGWDIGKLMDFHSKSMKEHGCNVDQHFETQKTKYLRKLLKIDTSWAPKIHQKSWKIDFGIHESTPECILASLGHQNASKEASTSLKVMPKWCCGVSAWGVFQPASLQPAASSLQPAACSQQPAAPSQVRGAGGRGRSP